MQKFIKSEKYQSMKIKYEKNYFKINGLYAYYNGDKIDIKPASQIQEYFKNKKIKLNVGTEDEYRIKEKSFYQIWSEDPDMKEYQEIVFDCNVKKVKRNKFNLFTGFDIKDHVIKDEKARKVKKGLEVIHNHISLLCNHSKDGIETVKYFYAQALQQPHILPNFCLVFISKEGVGKDLFSQFMESIFGEKYCFNTDKLEHVVGKFNSMFGGKIIGVINETDPVDSRQRRDNIKYAITAKTVLVEGKYKDAIKTNNYCRLTFYANRLTAFPIEDGSRRPYIQYCSSEKLPKNIGAEESKKYFDTLVKYIEDKDVQKAFYDELMSYDINKFNFKEQEKSNFQKLLEDSSKPPLSEFLYELVSSSPLKFIKVKTVELLEAYTNFNRKRNMKFDMTAKVFSSELIQDYKVKKYFSSGYQKFSIDVEFTKELLQKEYNYIFDEEEEENDDDDEEYSKTDLSVKMSKWERIQSLKTTLRKLESELMNDLDTQYKKSKSKSKPKQKEENRKISFKPMNINKNIFDVNVKKEQNTVIVDSKTSLNNFCENFF